MSIRINRVYTRSGDKGQTALIGGARVSKSNIRLQALGDIDELNARLGLIKEELNSKTQKLFEVIEYLQQELFDLGSLLAAEVAYDGMWQLSQEHIDNLEKLCDHFSAGQPELESFILPGGSKLAAQCHIARAIARRAERSIVALNEQQALSNEHILSYINRVSDLFFILARWALEQEEKEAPLWQKGRRLDLNL